VNQPDFEISASLQAVRLAVIVAAEPRVEGQGATLERQGTARELQKDHVANENVAVGKKVAGRLSMAPGGIEAAC
jgi:hypothetical protein